MRRSGFTLLEVCVVVGIIALLMTLGLYAFGAMRHNTKLKSAAATASVLKSAIEKYKQIYGLFPDRSSDARGPWKNFEIVRALRNWKIDSRLNDTAGRDPHFNRDAMLEKLEPAQLDEQDNCIDPWGTPYAIDILPDDVWKIFQKMAEARKQNAPLVLAADETKIIAPYSESDQRALYWVNVIKSQVNVYSFGADRACDYGYSYGDGSGYVKGPWGYYNKGDANNTAKVQRGDDVGP
jgi:prepilin-type N-terminal cleavage/methylation domain-containing protein